MTAIDPIKISSAIKKVESVSFWFSLALLPIAHYFVFLYVPNEKFMGPVQRIFYFHVASAFASYLSIAIVFLAALFYLGRKNSYFDSLQIAASEVGFVFCSVVLATGMIWGQAAWNTPFRLEPRLVSFLVVWLIFLSLVLVRRSGKSAQISLSCAILGILGAVSIPFMIYSIHLLPQFAQLHPQVMSKPGGLAPEFKYALLVSSLALLSFAVYLISFRFRIAELEKKYGI